MSQEILNLARYSDQAVAELRQASPLQVAASLTEFLNQQDREQYLDFDRLITTGGLLRAARQCSLDATVEEWIDRRKDCRRFGVATSFLAGYWDHGSQAEESLVRSIIAQLCQCESDRNAFPSMLLALCQAPLTAVAEETKSLTRSILITYLPRADELRLDLGVIEETRKAMKPDFDIRDNRLDR